jgi:hypothetical protein
MTRFTETLRDINDRLDLPQPARSRVLLEIAADLDGLHRYYCDRGLSEEEARRRAVEQCDLSDEALAELTRVHLSPYRRFLDRLGAQARTRWERALLAVFLLIVAVMAGGLATSGDVFRVAGPPSWPALALTLAALALGLQKLYTAHLSQDHDLTRLRAGSGTLLVLAGLNLLTGVTAYSLVLYRIARHMAIDVNEGAPLVTQSLLSGSALLVICLLAAIVCSVLWFLVENQIGRIEEAEAALLLNG